MQRMLQRFSDLKVEPGQRTWVDQKVKDLQAEVSREAKAAAARQEADQAALSAAASACPPGLIRTGST
jgi:hypothetical protein